MGKNQKKKNKRYALKEKIQNESITNLSDYSLSKQEKSLLLKGLSYIPHQKPILKNFQEDLNVFIENIYKAHFFREIETPPPILFTPSKWKAPIPVDPLVNSLVIEINSILLQTPQINFENFPQTPEMDILNKLMKNPNLIFKKADKGGGIVLFNKKDYISKALEHLNDIEVYSPQPQNFNENVFEEVNEFIDTLEIKNILAEKTIKYIRPQFPSRTPIFYFMPKIHKPGYPPRPIISGCDSPTANLSKFLTKVFDPIVKIQKSYLKGTKHLLQILEDIELPPNPILVTGDVRSLYTNIPAEDGINACLKLLDFHRPLAPKFTPNNRIIRTFLEFILNHNFFEFAGEYYQQILGTAMGTRAAPHIANLFMADLENPLILSHFDSLALFRRFIDDVLLIWKDGEASLKDFLDKLNSLHPTIKFDFQISKERVNFLDLEISIKKNKLVTNIYRKPTDKHLILHFESRHPFHMKRNILYSQAIRYIRNISCPHILNQELALLTNIFLARGYPLPLIKREFKRASNISRKTLLTDKPKPIFKKRIVLKIPKHIHNKHKVLNSIKSKWDNTKIPNILHIIHKNDPKIVDKLIHTKTTP